MRNYLSLAAAVALFVAALLGADVAVAPAWRASGLWRAAAARSPLFGGFRGGPDATMVEQGS